MKAVVVGVFALASALVREREDAVRDWNARAEESQAFAMPRVADGDVGGGPTVATAGSSNAEGQPANVTQTSMVSSSSPEDVSTASGDESSDDASAGGQWQIACEIKTGSALVFDRASLREYGTMTLFRWSAPRTRIAGPGDQIFTAVVN